MVTDDVQIQLRILRRLASVVSELSLESTPAVLSQPAYDIVSEITGVRDPYKKIKKQTNRIALEMLPYIREQVEAVADPLEMALHAAAAGNIIDLGIGYRFDIQRDIIRVMNQPFALSSVQKFKADIGPNRNLLYLGDNAGEIVFDRILIEQLKKIGTNVVFVVKSQPIINDAIMEDAEISGIVKLTEVIETGSGDIGINFNNISSTFRHAYKNADVILSKGQGNFESCNDSFQNIYFLLKAKCDVVAKELNVKLGDVVFKGNLSR